MHPPVCLSTSSQWSCPVNSALCQPDGIELDSLPHFPSRLLMHFLGLLLILLALLLLWFSSRKRKESGLPGGRIIYSDTGGWARLEKPLYASSLSLTGKPDYLIEQGRTIIPVEVKSSRIPDSPYDSHIYQLAAYCLLIEKALGKRPPYGIIHYKDRSHDSRSFAIDYTEELEEAVLEIINEIRTNDKRKDVGRQHESYSRCHSCGYNSVCDEKLEG
jgi:CRISPR-associated exonuclease Cas4